MNIEEFLLARVEEAHHELSRLREIRIITMAQYQQFGVMLHMQKELIQWHRQWPILVEGSTEFESPNVLDDYDPGAAVNNYAMKMSKQMAWFTHAEYQKKFGIEPPAAPLLRRMAMFYTTHPDYNEEWRV